MTRRRRRAESRPFSEHERESATRERYASHADAMASVENYTRAVEVLVNTRGLTIPTRRFRIWTPSPGRWIVVETDRESPKDIALNRELAAMLASLDLRRT